MFVAIEGPNGVGKSTVLELAADQLRLLRGGAKVLSTREPSGSALGTAIRGMESELTGYALGLACAADRLHHVATEIAPALQRGALVLTDRYVPSSLVLQQLDGLTMTAIWQMNETARPPDLTIYLEDDPHLISARLADRGTRSRLESAGGPQRELDLYADARAFLEDRGWRQVVVSGEGREPDAIASQIVSVIVDQ